MALISLVIGLLTKRSSTKNSTSICIGAITALILGIISVVLSINHLIVTSGAVFGSGSGKAGAIVALLPAAIGIFLGWSMINKKTTNR